MIRVKIQNGILSLRSVRMKLSVNRYLQLPRMEAIAVGPRLTLLVSIEPICFMIDGRGCSYYGGFILTIFLRNFV